MDVDDLNSALVVHRNDFNHRITLSDADLIWKHGNTAKRKFIESFIIKNTENFNLKGGEYKIDNLINSILLKTKRFKDFKKKFAGNYDN